MRKKVAIYVRVSTCDQTVENQRRELEQIAKRHDWDIVAVFEDVGISGVKGREERPSFDRLYSALVRREFDLVAVWSVDRIGRSLKHLISFLDDLNSKNIDLYIHNQGIDTSTPGGKALFQMMGVFAEFERAFIVERINAGLARAKAQGVQLGRPKVSVTKEKAIKADLLSENIGMIKIAKKHGVGVSTVQRVKREIMMDAL